MKYTVEQLQQCLGNLTIVNSVEGIPEVDSSSKWIGFTVKGKANPYYASSNGVVTTEDNSRDSMCRLIERMIFEEIELTEEYPPKYTFAQLEQALLNDLGGVAFCRIPGDSDWCVVTIDDMTHRVSFDGTFSLGTGIPHKASLSHPLSVSLTNKLRDILENPQGKSSQSENIFDFARWLEK